MLAEKKPGFFVSTLKKAGLGLRRNARQQAIGAAEQEEATRQQAEVLRLQAQTVVSEAHEEVGQTRALAERYAAEVRNRANAEQA